MPAPEAPPVVLLHGLGRTARSMRRLSGRLKTAGFAPHNTAYPSTCHPIADLVAEHVAPIVERVRQRTDGPIHFVTHSLGGILVRAFDAEHDLPPGSRLVMLAPPNAGSEVADLVRGWWPTRQWCGPALQELGTGPDSVPLALGAPSLKTGVIAGTRPAQPWFYPTLGATNDGIVAARSAWLPGAEFVTVPSGHTFIMARRDVAAYTVRFLKHGTFGRRPASGPRARGSEALSAR